MRILILVCLALVCAAAGAARSGPSVTAGALPEALGGKAQPGFARALRPRPFVFPADYGPHPDFRNEWWYLTGNLTSRRGRRFGYELTIFRIALKPGRAHSSSRWRKNQVYMAHFALTDVRGRSFHAFERISRPVMGMAGAEASPLHVWVDTWSMRSAGASEFPLRVQAATHGIGIDLLVEKGKPVVAEGDGGLSRKSAKPGNASYYYSLTRMPTRGRIVINGRRFKVSGDSWLDREWSTSALGSGQIGWDWFALQLSDNSELMYYRLRRRDGSISPFSAGTLIAPDGSTRHLKAADVSIKVLAHWRSPRGGRYPSRWRVRVPSARLTLDVKPALADQELNLNVRYWEGAVSVSGSRAERPVTGRGYVELTGYARKR